MPIPRVKEPTGAGGTADFYGGEGLVPYPSATAARIQFQSGNPESPVGPQTTQPFVQGVSASQLTPGVLLPSQTLSQTIDIKGVNGEIIARIGDISGMSWGGSNEFIPTGTFGVWGTRAGIWFKAGVQLFYANARQDSVVFSGITIPAGHTTSTWTFTVDETFPFSTVSIMAGRIVTSEFIPYSITQTNTGTSITTLDARLQSFAMRASRNGGGASDFNYLAGPSAGGLDKYTSLTVRPVYSIVLSTATTPQTFDLTLTRIALIRLFAHEVNSATTLSTVSSSEVTGSSPVGARAAGSGTDVSGGSGTASGGYGAVVASVNPGGNPFI